MLVEHFQESMVFLKKDLCWDYEDLASLKLNLRIENSKSIISERAKKILKNWIKDSYTFYDYFKV